MLSEMFSSASSSSARFLAMSRSFARTRAVSITYLRSSLDQWAARPADGPFLRAFANRRSRRIRAPASFAEWRQANHRLITLSRAHKAAMRHPEMRRPHARTAMHQRVQGTFPGRHPLAMLARGPLLGGELVSMRARIAMKSVAVVQSLSSPFLIAIDL